MSLAELFYAKHPRRVAKRLRPRGRPQRNTRPRFALEPLEGRVLLAVDPLALAVPITSEVLIEDPALTADLPEPPPPPAPAGDPAPESGEALASETSDVGPYPVPLDAVEPLGSMAYDPPVAGALDAVGEVDTFTLNLDAGQTVTVRFSAIDPSIRGQIELLDPGAAVLGTASAGVAGEDVILQTVAASAAGTYSLTVTSLEGTGAYEAQVVLNAALELESFGGPANDDTASAQDISASAVTVQGTATRLAVLGATEGAFDLYSFELTAGEAATLVLTRTDEVAPSGLGVDLLDGSGALLTVGFDDATNTDGAIRDFVAPSSGTYYARVTGAAGQPYSLVVTRGAGFDAEPNRSAAEARDLGPSGQALGSVGLVSGGAVSSGIRVAVHGLSYGPTVASRLNDDTYFDFTATVVSGSQIDTLGELQSYDVVVIGDSGYYSQLDALAPALRAFVEAGGGVVGTGWLIYGAGTATPPAIADINAIIPVNTAVYYNYYFNPTISIVDATHPITLGLPNFNPGSYVEFSTGGVDAGASVLGTASGQPVIVAGDAGAGRGVYLGPIYLGGMGWSSGTATDRLLEQAVAWAAGGGPDTADQYAFQASAGDALTITTATPGDGAGQPENTLDPILELYDPTGILVASNNNGAADGRNALINYTTAMAGTFRVRVAPVTGGGDYTVRVTGATGAAASLDVEASSVADGALLAAFPGTLTLAFDSPFLFTSVDAGDLTVNGSPTTAVTILDPQTLEFDIAALEAGDGAYTVALAAGEVTGINGADNGAFGLTFTLDTTGPSVIASSIIGGEVLAPGDLVFTATFDEDLASSGLGAEDALLVETFTGQVYQAGGFQNDSGTDQTTFTFAGLRDGSYTLTLLGGATGFRDLVGNALQPFSVDLSVDTSTGAFPVPLEPKVPLGSLIYDPSFQGAFHEVGDADALTLDVDAGQTVTLVLLPDGPAVRARVELFDPADVSLGAAEASAAGLPAILQTVPAATAGTYRIEATSLEGTGAYELVVVLNAAVEEGIDTSAPAGAVEGPLTIATPFHVRDNVGPNTVGSTAGDRAILGALSITPSGAPTAASATQDATTQPLFFLPSPLSPNQYAASRPFDAGLTGQWSITAARDAETTGRVLTPAIGDPELLPLVTDVVVTGTGLTPTISWTLPDLTGFDVEQIRVRVTDDVTNQMLFRSAPLAAGTTGYTIPDGVLENGGEYVFSIELEDWEGGSLENRSRTFTQAAYVPVQAIDGSAVTLQGAADRLAVIGDARGGNDYFTFTLGAGQLATLALTPLVGGDLDLALLDDAGNLLALGIAGAANVGEHIEGFVAPAAGTYRARVSGTADPDEGGEYRLYSLVVTRDAAFDLEPNTIDAQAQDLGVANQALGSLGSQGGGGAIRVAVHAAYNGSYVASTLNDDTFFDFTATVVSTSDIDTVAELRNFDVVLIGDQYLEEEFESYYPTFPAALRQWVEQEGGGVVGSGWIVYAAGTSTGTAQPDIDAIVPVNTSTSYASPYNPTLVITDPTHPITLGVPNFSTGTYTPYSLGGVDPGATVLGTVSGEGVVVAADVGAGRGVYLGTVLMDGNTWSSGGPLDRLVEQALAWAGAGDDADHYRFQASEGDSLVITTTTPGDGGGEPENGLDPALELYDPSGVLVASDLDGAADGRNARIEYTVPAGGAGQYRLVALVQDGAGAYTVRVAGATGAAAAPLTIVAVDPNDGQRLPAYPGVYRVDFSESLLLTSVDATDLTVNGIAADSVAILDHDTLEFTIASADAGEGSYDVALAVGALTSLSGAPVETFAATFVVDTTPPVVVSSSVADGGFVAAGDVTIEIGFSEALDTAVLGPEDVRLVSGTGAGVAPSALGYDGRTDTLSLTYLGLAEGDYTLTLLSGAGAFQDVAGNALDGEPGALPSGDGTAGGDFVVTFTADIAEAAYPVPLEPKAPSGSLIHDPSAAGVLHDGDTDAWTLDLDGGQALTVVAAALEPSLRMRVEVFGPDAVSLGSAEAGAPGESVFLQTVPVGPAGTYRIAVTSAEGTGGYAAQALLNAAAEEEITALVLDQYAGAVIDFSSEYESPEWGAIQVLGPPNVFFYGDDELAWAPSEYDGTIEWVTVGYDTPVFATGVTVRENLGSGFVTRVEARDLAGDFHVVWEGEDPSLPGTVVDFLVTFDQTTYLADAVRVTIDTGINEVWEEIDAITLHGSTAPLGSSSGPANDTLAEAQDIDGSAVAIGSDRLAVVGRTDSGADDFYAFTGNAGEFTTLVLTAFGPEDIALELQDAGGVALASGLAGARNVDRFIRGFVPQSTGTYYARVSSAGAVDYSLVVTRGADFDLETEEEATRAQDLTAVSQALGGLGGAAGAEEGSAGPTVSLTTYLVDGGGWEWDINGDGDIGDGTDDAYDGGLYLVVNGSWFDWFSSAQTEESGREIVIGPDVLASLQVTRKVYVPTDESFARYLEILHNPGASTVDVTVQINTDLGSDSGTQLIATSSGDAAFNASDNWVVSDDAQDGDWDPTMLHVVAGPGGAIRPTSASLASDDLNYWYDLSIGPGETKIVMHFASQNPSRAAAITRGPQLEALELGALDGMSDAERAAVVNFEAGDAADHYAIRANVGDTLIITTSTPGDGAGEPENTLDPRLVLYDPSGNAVATDEDGAGDGRNARIEYTVPEGAAGLYRIGVEPAEGAGAYVLAVEGSTAEPPAFIVTASDPADGALLTGFPATYRVDLSEAVLLTSVDAGDLLVNGVAADAVTAVDADTLEFSIAGAAAGDGLYTVTIAAGALTSLGGAPITAFTATFDSDLTNPAVAASSLAEGDTVPAGDLVVQVQFSEELAAEGLGPEDALLFDRATGDPLRPPIHGLRGEYFLPGGDLLDFPDFDALTPVHVRVDEVVNFPSTSADFGGFTDLDDQFAVRWTGELLVTDAGTTWFYTQSDDGSRLYIDDQLVVDNGGLHGMRTIWGSIDLAAGSYDLRLEYFERTGSAGVILSWEPPVGSSGVIPSSALIAGPGGADAFAYDPGTSTATITYLALPEGDYTLRLVSAADGFRDRRGNLLDGAPSFPLPSGDGVPGDDFAVNFQVDVSTAALPPLEPVEPLGSLVYDPPVPGLFHAAGDADAYTMDVEAGQVVSVRLIPLEGPIQAQIELLDATLAVVASASAGAAGETVLLQTAGTGAGGAYTIRATSLAGAGAYQLEVVLNAAFESGDASAQSLEGSSVALAGTADRLAVLGVTDGDDDVYTLDLAAGQVATFAVRALDESGAVSLALLDDGSSLLAIGTVDAENADGAIRDFVAPAAGTYRVRVSGPAGHPYNLIGTRRADFDLEPGVSGAAQDISLTGQVLGALPGTMGVGGAIRVAVHGSSYAPYVAAQLNDDTYFDFDAVVVSASQIDSLAELDAYDVVVIGDSSREEDFEGYNTTFPAALRQWVEQEGGGVVGTGWIVYAAGIGSGTAQPDIDAIIPVNTSASYNYSSGQTVSVIDTGHPVTEGLASFLNPTYTEFSSGGADAGATVLGTVLGQPAIVVETPGDTGRSVYLGPIYLGTSHTGLRTASLDRLLEQAVAWAGGGSDRVDEYLVRASEGDTLTIATSTPGDGPGLPDNAPDLRLELYNPLGFLVTADDNSAPDARNARILYTVPAGAAGDYQVRVYRAAAGDDAGAYVLEVTGATGGLGPAPSVVDSTPAAGQNLLAPPVDLVLELSEAVRVDSLDAGDLLLAAEDGLTPVAVTGVDIGATGDVVVFHLSVPDVEQEYSYTLVQGAFLDLQGLPSLSHAGTFRIDHSGPRVVAQQPALQTSAPFTQIQVTFDEPLAPGSVSTADIASFTGPGGTNLLGQVTGVSVAGATLTVTFNAQNAQGTYTMVLGPQITDVVGNLMDQNDNGVGGQAGDTYTATVDLQSPDLRVEALATPSSAQFGQQIDVTFTVRNVGSDPAVEGWSDRLWLSSDGVLSGDDVQLFTGAAPTVPLVPGGDYTETIQVTLPLNASVTTGVYFVIAQTDALSTQPESSEANNTRVSEGISLALPPLPDLVVSDIVAPLDALSGQAVPITWTLTNQGTGAASGAWSDYVYLSTDQAAGSDQYFGGFQFEGTIGPGESVTRTQTITLPVYLTGTRYVVVVTDAAGQLFEHANEGNNTRVDDRAMTISQSPVPNLVVSSVTPPSEAFSSQDTVVSWTVTNTGTGATSSPYWYDAIYLSLDPTLDEADTLLGSAANPSYLAHGDSYAQSATVRMPRGIDGNYFFLVKSDVYNYVFEAANENDNVGAGGPARVNLTPPPDLQVVSVNAPQNAFSGQLMQLGWRVENLGTGRTLEGSWYDRIYMSADETVDAGDRILLDVYHGGALDEGVGYDGQGTVFLPVGVSGEFFFLVRTDVFNHVYEHALEDNNDGSDPVATIVNLTPPPDLEVLDVTVPATALAGHALTITYEVANFGATPTPNANWTDSFYLSADETLDPAADLLLGDGGHYGGLDVDESYVSAPVFTLPNGLEGTFYAFVHTDRPDQVFELDNANNRMASLGTVTVESRPADLAVSAASAPASAEAGTSIRVDWTVMNFGTGDTIATGWTDRVLASLNATAGDGDDVALADFGHGGLLNPGQSYSRSELVTIPFSFVGEYFLFVRTDLHGQVYEGAAEGNNASPALPLAVTRETPDLQVVDVEAPAAATTGEVIRVDWIVENAGAHATNAFYWYDAVYFSRDPVLSNDDRAVGVKYRSNPLDPGASYATGLDFAVPSDLASGAWYALVATDVYNYVLEDPFENNNVGASPAAITVTPGVVPVPDLVLESVEAPSDAISGQAFDVTWTVRNTGDPTGAMWWDAVYLSRDQIFDRASDTYLGYRYPLGGLGTGEAYTVTHTFTVPNGFTGPFYVFVAADRGNYVTGEASELNNSGYDSGVMDVALAPPADLVVGIITIPANGVPGQYATITYSIRNEGENAALGSWYDSLYISADDQWDVGDPLFARAWHGGGVAAGSSYSEDVTAALPGVTPGDYHVIVRSDILNYVPESDEGNNIGASLDRVLIDAEVLPLGTPVGGFLYQSQSIYYRFDIGAGETVRLTLDGALPNSSNEVYVRFGAMPTRGQFDAAFTEPFAPDQEVVLPSTQAGTYYVLLYGASVPGYGGELPEYTLLAEVLPFSLREVSPQTVGTQGPTTFEITGAKFSPETVFEMIDPSGRVVGAANVEVEDTSLAYVRFDLRGQETGAWDLRLTAGDGTVVLLEDGITVVEGVGPQIFSSIQGPRTIRPARLYTFSLAYSNGGDSDAMAPLFVIDSSTHTPFGTTYDTVGLSSSVQLLGVSLDGPQDTLRPGDQHAISMVFRSTQPTRFHTRTIAATNTDPIDLDLLEASLRIPGLSDDEWGQVWFQQIRPSLPDTWGEYVQLLNHLSRTFSEPGQPISDVRALFQRLYQDDPDFQPTASVAGQILDPAGLPRANTRISAYREEDGLTVLGGSALTDASGFFTVEGLFPATYTLQLEELEFDNDLDGEADVNAPEVTMTTGGDVTGFQYFAIPLTPPHVDDAEPVLATDWGGTSHLLWQRDGEIWHAWYDGLEWVDAAPIPGAMGGDLGLGAAPTLIDGTDPGLVATWRLGAGNESEAYYAVARPLVGGGFEWSEPVALTDDTVYDNQPTLLVTDTGEVLVVHQKSDYDIEDDSDLYYALTGIDGSTLVFPAAALAAAGGELDPLGTSISVSVGFKKEGSIPKVIPVIGGKSGIEIKGTLTGSADCTASVSGQVEGSVELFERARGSASISGSAEWKAKGDPCAYVFKKGSVSVGIGISGDIPGWIFTVPGDGFFIGKIFEAEVGVTIQGNVSGTAEWPAGSAFPSFPPAGNVSVGAGIGPYGKVSVLDGLAEGKVSGIGSVGLQVLPSFSLQSLSFTLSLEAVIGGSLWGWSKSWTKDDFSSLANLDEALFGGTLSSGGSLPEGLTITYAPTEGTGNVYPGTPVLADVATDLFNDEHTALAQAPDGEILLAWAKAKDPDEGEGSTIMLSSFDGTDWSAPVEIAGSLGYIGSVGLAFDAEGRPVVAWTGTDTSGLTPDSTPEERYEAATAGEVFYAVREGSPWSAASSALARAGNDSKAALGAAADGRLLLTWVNHTSDGEDHLLGSFWDASAWTVVDEIAAGQIVGDATIGQVGGLTTVFWSEDVNAHPGITDLEIFSSSFNAGWTVPSGFAPELAPEVAAALAAEDAPIESSISMPAGPLCAEEGTPDKQALTGQFLPTPPEECCKKEEEEDDDDDADDDDDYNPDVVIPRDPNDILGPEGFGPEHWVPSEQPLTLPYTIRFENAADATAPAQQVVITQTLDADLDPRTFRVDDFGWGDYRVELPANRSFYNERLDLRDNFGFFVDVSVVTDVTTGALTWTLTTIDPETGEQPLDAQVGFLPTNDETGRGEGFVSYTVRPRRSLPTGTVVDAVARIIFDTEEPIDTPPIFNTLDAVAPASAVGVLPETVDTPEFLVGWTGTDDEGGSAISFFDVFVSVDGGAFGPWLTGTALLESRYQGAAGHSYAFYSVAHDNAGNEEGAPAEADARVTVLAVGEEPGSLAGVKWEDLDGDGLREDGEPGLADWVIYLDADLNGVHDDGEIFATTDATGAWALTGLVPGDYRVREEEQGGWLQTSPAGGAWDVTLASGTALTGLDFGNFRLAEIGGVKYRDLDGDGAREEGEPGLAGWVIYLDLDGSGAREGGEPFATTDGTGAWALTGLGPGPWTVAEELQPGWTQTAPAGGTYVVALTSGATLTGLDFGNHMTPAELHGAKWEDLDGDGIRDAGEPGLPGWVIYLDLDGDGALGVGEPSTATDADGQWAFTDLVPGTYVVAEVQQPGWMQTAPNVGGEGSAAITTTGAEAALYTPETPVTTGADLTAEGLIDQANLLTGLDELRADPRFAGLDGSGIGVVVIDTGVDVDHPFFGTDADLDGVADRIVYQWDFADVDADASDRVGHGSHVTSLIGSEDAAYAGVAPGVDLIALKVFEDGGAGYFSYLERALQWVVENADAYHVGVVNMSLGDSRNWTMAVTQYGLGDELAALAAENVILVAAAGNSFYELGGVTGVAYPAADPAVLAVGAVWTDDFGGPWRFTNGAIDYTTGPDRIASFSQRDDELLDTFAPGARLTGAGADGGTLTMQGTSQASAYVAGAAALAQQLALQDLGRRLSVGELSALLAATGDQVLDGDDEQDNVWNTQLAYPRIDVLALAEAILALDGSGADPDPGGSSGNGGGAEPAPATGGGLGTHTVTVAAGEILTGLDFGNFRLGEIRGVKFEDLDGDGARAAGEAGLSGWTIYLDANNNAALDGGETSTTTDVTGAYAFTDLGPGVYVVREVQRAGWTATTPTAGDHEVTMTSGLVATGLDFGNRRMNEAPVLEPVADRIGLEGQLLQVQLTATDADGPAPLAFSLVSGPAGMTVDAQTGLLQWTPGEAEGGSFFDVFVEVSDGDLTSDTSFRVRVDEMLNGTAGADRVAVSQSAGGVVTVTINGVAQTLPAGAQGFGLSLGDNNDVLTVSGLTLALWVDGGAGNDTLRAYSTVTGPVTLLGGPGNDLLAGGQGNDILDGGEGDDTLVGSGGDDLLVGGSGNDQLTGSAGNDVAAGGEGNDRFTWTVGEGQDALAGGGGADLLTVNGFVYDDALAIGGIGGGAVGVAWTTPTPGQFGFAEIEQLTVVLREGNDTLTLGEVSGTALLSARVEGGAGNDYVDASGTAIPVTLLGGDGDDTLLGGSGDDTLDGGAGTDVLDGGGGTNVVTDPQGVTAAPVTVSPAAVTAPQLRGLVDWEERARLELAQALGVQGLARGGRVWARDWVEVYEEELAEDPNAELSITI